jgi:hypothetical protein
MVFATSSLATLWAIINVRGIHQRSQHFIPSTYWRWSQPVDVAIPRDWAILSADEWWSASILSDYLGKSFVWSPSWTWNRFEVRSSLSPIDVSDPSVRLAARHRTIPVVICEAWMSFNPHAVLVSEKFNHIALFNHINQAVLAGSIRSLCCNLHGHWKYQTNFNQPQTPDVRFLALLIIYCDYWRRSRFRFNITHPVCFMTFQTCSRSTWRPD